MAVAVLGPLQVDGQRNGLSPRDRVVLAALAVSAPEPMSTEAIADALWGNELPASWAKVVHGCVSRLRRRLGTAAIDSGPYGYRLTLGDDELDFRAFERLLERGREALSGGDPRRSSYLVQEALDLWRGGALGDLEEWGPGRVEAARLEGLRMEAEELHVDAEVRAGHAPAVLEQARALVAQAPFRERRWALLATALYQAGRQAEALGALKRARAMLVDELGLDPGRELEQLEQQLLRHDPSLTALVGHKVSPVCPYRGLLPYGAEDADSFFGRENDIAACLRRLRDSGALAVVGPSGIGKSSLVRAGVVASLVRTGTPVLVTTPGEHPVDSLSGLKSRGRQILVVDQAEEAVTVCSDPDEPERYFAALAAHVAAGRALVVALRSDHLGALAPYPDIARVLEDGLYLLGPMREPDLRSAVEGPARRAGLRLEPGLVDLLVREVEGEPAALPMLSHVLRETWERREGPTLTVAGYRATGGIRFAVSQSAEALYEAMDPAQRGRLRDLLLRLVMSTEDGDPVRARVPRGNVAGDDAHARLVEELVAARLISVDQDTVQIAHEALVRGWPRLRGWLDDDIDGQRIFRHLVGAADAWDAMGRPDSELYRGARLSRALEWQERATPDLNDTEAAFISASAALADTELRAAETRIAQQRQVNRRLRNALAGVGVLLVLTLVAGGIAIRAADRAQRDRDRAQNAARLADADEASAQAALHQDVDTGLLLAVAALRVDPSPQAWENLGTALARAGPLAGMRDLGDLVGRPGTAWIASSAASADGALVAASLAEEGVQLLDATALTPLEFADDTPSSAVAFSPDGKQLAVAVNQFNGSGPPRIDALPIRLHDVPGGARSDAQLGGLPDGSAVEYSLGFSEDGSRLAAAALRRDRSGSAWKPWGTATVWDLSEPEQPVFQKRVPDFTTTTLSPDGARLYLVAPGQRPLRVYDVDTGLLVGSSRATRLTSVRENDMDVSPNGSLLAVSNGTQVLRFDTRTLQPRGPALSAHTAAVTDVGYSHNGQLIVTASADGTAIVWDARSGAQLHRFVARGALNNAVFGAEDQNVFTTGGDGLLMVWDVTGASRLLTLGEDVPSATGGEPYLLSLLAPDGHTVARVRAGKLWFEDARTGRRVTRAVANRDTYFVWSPDARWLLSGGESDVIRLWDTATGAVAAEARTGAESDLLAVFSADSSKVHVRESASVIATLDRASLQPAEHDIRLAEGVSALLPHPTDGSLIALQYDGSFAQVRPETGEILRRAPPGLLPIEDQIGALSPDGSLMAAADANHNLRLLDLETLEWVGPDTHTPIGAKLLYAPDGSQFATLQPERIQLWDGRTGAYQASLPLPSRRTLLSISYAPDSTGLLLASTDGRTWSANTRTSTWVPRACRTAGRNLTQVEWKQYFPNMRYEVTCPQWPPGK